MTRAAEELQEHYTTNEGLSHNIEIQEQKIYQLEDQIMHYKALLEQKSLYIASLEHKDASRTYAKRENRSVSVPRMTHTRGQQSSSFQEREHNSTQNNLS